MGKIISVRIWQEVERFVSAFFSGVFLYTVYHAIENVRLLLRHKLWLISVEDALYWGMALIYLFVQIYDTNNGVIRGYYVLGIVFGASFAWKSLQIISKVWKKFIQSRKQKKVDKFKKKG